MYFQITKIVLWPKNRQKAPRILPFLEGKVNVISGSSRTGKSAIIPIIDYCLGSDNCSIPVKTIRDACEWFGVVVKTKQGEKLFARREPGMQKSTDAMFVLEGESIEIPESIDDKNTNTGSVKRSLDELAGLTALDFDTDGTGNNFKGRPSFRDMAAFNFQPQNIVANPDIMFFKADTYEHRQKLVTIFPYILDAITPALLAKQHELGNLKKELQRKENELKNIRQVSSSWVAEAQVWISKAREYGLINYETKGDISFNQLYDILYEIASNPPKEVKTTVSSFDKTVEELLELRKEETKVSFELSTLRRRFTEMTKLKEGSQQYLNSLHVQQDRLAVSEWLSEIADKEHECPICRNSLESAVGKLGKLCENLKEIEKTAGDFGAIPAAFDKEFERVKSEIRMLTERLGAIQYRVRSLETVSEEAKKLQYRAEGLSRYIGNVEYVVKTFKNIGSDGELLSDIQRLKDRIKELEGQINDAQINAKKRRALEIISQNIAKIIPDLDSERPDDPVQLLIDDLTVKVKGENREDYLWEIGSGSNWLAYHVAVSLGLQQFFCKINHSPVPGFIVYDQPSQVYFPQVLAAKKEDEKENEDPTFTDEDISAVRKVFQVLDKFITGSKGTMQVLVLDHAPKTVWEGIDNIHFVEEWRNGVKLVPMDWL